MKNAIIALLLFTSMTAISQKIKNNQIYVCPPCNNACDQAIHSKPGVCAHCNMVLVRKDLSKTIAFYLQDGVEILDFAGPMEVFAYSGYKVITVSEKKEAIKSQGILKVVPDYSIDDAPEADILAFFGGNAQAAYKKPQVIEWIQKQEHIQYYFSVCTGAFVLAEAGILDSKVATTFHNALGDLEANYSKIDVRRDVRFVDNGKVITTAGISAGIDGALHLVAKLQGVNTARRTAYYMEYDNWAQGDGLILSDDNPYIKSISSEKLKEYTGTYEYKNNSQFDLVYNSETNDLNAIINKVSFPIYHENADVFSDVSNEPVFFKRNKNGEFIGYSLTKEGKIYSKLK